MYTVCIVGGGASGMATAISLIMKNPSIDIVMLEKKEKLGKKILATGNGKCNISNINAPTFDDSCAFFRQIGVEIKIQENGRAYPVSEQAKDVVEAMVNFIKSHNIKVIINCNVKDITISRMGHYQLSSEDLEIEAENVILATGGKAAPQFGTVGDGYRLAKKLGHNTSKLHPALVGLKCKNEMLGIVSGVRAKCKVSLFRDKFLLKSEEGELQFTKYGLSGICIFNMSNSIKVDKNNKFENYSLSVDFLFRYTFMEAFHILTLRKNIQGMKTENMLLSLVNQEISKKILKGWSDKVQVAKNLRDEDIEEIINTFKNLTFKVIGVNGWKEAQCTSGGILREEIDMETMESKICKGLYFAGEIIDYDGPCGGFNLENAWTTGRKIGNNVCFTE